MANIYIYIKIKFHYHIFIILTLKHKTKFTQAPVNASNIVLNFPFIGNQYWQNITYNGKRTLVVIYFAEHKTFMLLIFEQNVVQMLNVILGVTLP